MSEPQLTFHELARQLHFRQLPVSDPSSDLWQRIVATHHARVRRARVRRGIVVSTIAAVALAVFVLVPQWQTPADGEVDWQARAQALELQLHTLPAGAARADSGSVIVAQAEIARVDDALQAAYDTGAQKSQLAPLWKRRSELLGMLISVHRQRVEISRI